MIKRTIIWTDIGSRWSTHYHCDSKSYLPLISNTALTTFQ